MIGVLQRKILFCLPAFFLVGGLAGQVRPLVVAPADPVRNPRVAAITVDAITVGLDGLPGGCSSGGGVILPISTPELTATRLDPAQVLLEWKTYDDDRTNRWVLQRRFGRADDFSNVRELTEINFLRGDHTDLNDYQDESYYRLYGISPEGEEVYSAIAVVGNVRRLGQLLVYPNPVMTVASVSLPSVSSLAQLTLVDGLGRIVWRAVHPEGGSTTIQLPVLTPGAYLLRWEVPTGQVATTRFVKTGR
jgi:hypothetical protein